MECDKCNEKFDHGNRRPRCLKCGHTQCSQCIVESIKTNKGIVKCATCLTSNESFTDNLLDFKENFTLLKMIEEGGNNSNKASFKEKLQSQVSVNLETLKKEEIERSLTFISECNEMINTLQERTKYIQLELGELEMKKQNLQKETEHNNTNISFGEDLVKKLQSNLEIFKTVHSIGVLKMTAEENKNTKNILEEWKKETSYSSNLFLETSIKPDGYDDRNVNFTKMDTARAKEIILFDMTESSITVKADPFDSAIESIKKELDENLYNTTIKTEPENISYSVQELSNSKATHYALPDSTTTLQAQPQDLQQTHLYQQKELAAGENEQEKFKDGGGNEIIQKIRQQTEDATGERRIAENNENVKNNLPDYKKHNFGIQNEMGSYQMKTSVTSIENSKLLEKCDLLSPVESVRESLSSTDIENIKVDLSEIPRLRESDKSFKKDKPISSEIENSSNVTLSHSIIGKEKLPIKEIKEFSDKRRISLQEYKSKLSSRKASSPIPSDKITQPTPNIDRVKVASDKIQSAICNKTPNDSNKQDFSIGPHESTDVVLKCNGKGHASKSNVIEKSNSKISDLQDKMTISMDKNTDQESYSPLDRKNHSQLTASQDRFSISNRNCHSPKKRPRSPEQNHPGPEPFSRSQERKCNSSPDAYRGSQVRYEKFSRRYSKFFKSDEKNIWNKINHLNFPSNSSFKPNHTKFKRKNKSMKPSGTQTPSDDVNRELTRIRERNQREAEKNLSNIADCENELQEKIIRDIEQEKMKRYLENLNKKKKEKMRPLCPKLAAAIAEYNN